MWTCTECGNENQYYYDHCGNCTIGKNGSPPQNPQAFEAAMKRVDRSPSGIWKCQNCGKENRNDRNHCWSCSTVRSTSNPEGLSVSQRVETPGVVDRPTICSKCSAPLDADAKFCPSCAAPVLLYTTINCPKCGKSISAGVKFCKYCAADLTKKEEYSFAPRVDYSRQDNFQNSPREKAERLALAGGITAGVSALAFLWGYSYTSSFANSARAGMMNLAGQTDSTYTFAQLCVTFGAIGFIIGIVLLIVGLAQR